MLVLILTLTSMPVYAGSYNKKAVKGSAYQSSTYSRNQVRKNHRRNKVIVIKPRYSRHNHWVTLGAVVGIALVLNSYGETVDVYGNQVVVLNSDRHSDNNTQVIYSNGITYILN